MKINKKPHHFFLIFFTGVIILSILIILFNLLVDPLELHHSKKIEGFNKIKVEVQNQARLHKALVISNTKPKIIFLGSSRVMAGLDPNYLNQMTGEFVYNCAFSGAKFEEIFEYFQLALKCQPDLKTVVIGLDLFGFKKTKKETNSIATRFMASSSIPWKDYYTSLYTAKACSASFKTVKANFYKTAIPFFLENGQYNLELSKTKGSFLDPNSDTDLIKRMFGSSEFYRNFKMDIQKVRLFKDLVEICKKRNIDLKLFFCPTKAVYWEAIYQKGFWNDLEFLKKQLTAIHPIWDFTGFNPITTQLNESSVTPYYIDCSHFSPYVGNIIIDQIFQQSKNEIDFGVLLTANNCEDHCNTIKQQRNRWISKNSKIAANIKNIIETVSKSEIKHKEY